MGNKSLEIKFFGVMNIIMGGLYSLFYALPFLLGVLVGWMTDRQVRNLPHWFALFVMDRISIAVIFIASLSLFKSGLLLLRLDQRARKMAIISSIAIILGEALYLYSGFVKVSSNDMVALDFMNIYALILFVFIFYLATQLFFLTNDNFKAEFQDSNIGLDLWIPLLIIIVSFVLPFMFKGMPMPPLSQFLK
ncbi:MAG: hypothetical protein BWY16_00468 [Candidatus Omnitrophica bacterium ADurb.Bin205]|nr:MAG: hypothetical protein BWY16_00468 [Candidatus Omnitrophica bacterium ADurb.Bin205]